MQDFGSINLNLCQSCKFIEKCNRHEFIATIIDQLEKEAFKQWGIDVYAGFSVEECDRYKMDPLMITGGDIDE